MTRDGRDINKKGSIGDIFLIMALLLVFSMSLLIGYKITNSFNTNIQADATMPAEAKTASTTLVGYYPGALDNVFLLFTIGICMVTLVLAALVRVHPMFLILFIISWILSIFIAAVQSNIYQTMAADPQLATEAGNMVIMSQVMNYLPLFIGVFGAILAVVMYKLWSNAQ
jgi:hypothetical protein